MFFPDDDEICETAIDLEVYARVFEEDIAKERLAVLQDRYFSLLKTDKWASFQDFLGFSYEWPRFIRDAFFSPRLKYKNRMIVTNFCIANGIPEFMLHDVLAFNLGENYTDERRNEICYRFAYFNPTLGNYRRSKAYSYDVILRKVVYLDGDIKMK